MSRHILKNTDTWAGLTLADDDEVIVFNTLSENIVVANNRLDIKGVGGSDVARAADQALIVDRWGADQGDTTINVFGLDLTDAGPGVGTADVYIGTGCLLSTTKNNVYRDNTITATLSDMTFNNNGRHGADIRGNTTATYKRCTADGNGDTATAHGFSTHPHKLEYNSSGWTQVSGTVYQRTITVSGDTPTTVYNVGVGSTMALDPGTGGAAGTLPVGEYEFVAPVLYINAGLDPNTKKIIAVFTTGFATYEQCLAINNIDWEKAQVEGAGFELDNYWVGGSYTDCVSADNEGDGFNAWSPRNATYTRCVSAYNTSEGFSAYWTTVDMTYSNCASVGNYRNFRFLGSRDLVIDGCVSAFARYRGYEYTAGTNPTIGTNYSYKDMGLSNQLPGVVEMASPFTDAAGVDVGTVSVSTTASDKGAMLADDGSGAEVKTDTISVANNVT